MCCFCHSFLIHSVDMSKPSDPHHAMVTRCILLGTLVAVATAQSYYGPLLYASSSDIDAVRPHDCALVIPNGGHRGRSFNVKPLNQFINSFPSSDRKSDSTCVTYDDINEAVRDAQRTSGRRVPHEVNELSSDKPGPEDIQQVSDIIVEATKILAHRFKLSPDVIIHSMPLVDTSKTVIEDMCPAFLKPVKCPVSRYRTISGMCNNLENPSWGSARSAFVRFIPPVYGDYVSDIKRSVDGSELPSPRIISFVCHQDISKSTPSSSNILVAWGQMIDHDLTLGAIEHDSRSMPIECCKNSPDRRHPACLPISVPDDDPFYKYFNKKCMNFARTRGGIETILHSRSFLDGGFIYGSNTERAREVRVFQGGLLKQTDMHGDKGMRPLLPMKTREPDIGCTRRKGERNQYCFLAGDDRVNEQLQLAVMHTMVMRYHNNIARKLQDINPHWDDETIYQETRHIMNALIQQVTYKEFLPSILGDQVMSKYNLRVDRGGYADSYDPKVNPGIRASFQTAAFRFGHSLLPDVTERYNKFHEKLGSIRLSQQLQQPFDLYIPGIVDTFMMGLVNQKANAMDDAITTEVTNHLFQKPDERFGMDLVAINIQRAREHGVPGYNAYREYCGLGRVRNFDQLQGILPNATVHRYQLVYKHVDDIDLWSAGVSEFPVNGGLIGPTFACLIGEQFAAVKFGDRFFYENKGWPSSFTPEQLGELKKFTLCRMMCDTGDDMETLQVDLMKLPGTGNPRVSCHQSDGPPVLDLSHWKDINYGKK
ncbi:Peroxidase [Nymphon striatum]|nr:Peroxidase [Nymphon striatum]